MASITTQNFSREFDLPTGNFILTDLTDYVGLGINPADVVGWYTIKGPDGVTFHTGSFASPDFTGAVPASSSIVIPLDVDGDPQIGNYTFTQYINVAGVVQPGTYDLQAIVNYCPDIPGASISSTVSCIFASVSVQDNTVVTDWTVNTRTFKLYNARPETTGSPYTTSGTLITKTSAATDIWPGTWTATLALDLSRTYSTGLTSYTVNVDVEGNEQFEVDCESLCSYLCQFKAMEAQYAANPTLQPSMLPDLILATGYLVAINFSVGCGAEFDTQASALTDIFNKYHIQDDCTCDDDQPIEPIGGAIPTVSIAGNGGVVVEDLGGGSYLVHLTTTNQNILAGARNVIPVAGTGITIGAASVDNTTSPPTWSYTISITPGTVPDVQTLDAFVMQVFPPLLPATVAILAVGTELTACTVVPQDNLTTGSPNSWLVTVTNTAAALNMMIQDIDFAVNGSLPPGYTKLNIPKSWDIRIYDYDTAGNFKFQLVDTISGQPYSWNTLSTGFSQMRFNIKASKQL